MRHSNRKSHWTLVKISHRETNKPNMKFIFALVFLAVAVSAGKQQLRHFVLSPNANNNLLLS